MYRGFFNNRCHFTTVSCKFSSSAEFISFSGLSVIYKWVSWFFTLLFCSKLCRISSIIYITRVVKLTLVIACTFCVKINSMNSHYGIVCGWNVALILTIQIVIIKLHIARKFFHCHNQIITSNPCLTIAMHYIYLRGESLIMGAVQAGP